jgi:shikimate dehydrogenase
VAGALRFAVIGHPVGHSRSPEIHAAFAAQFGIALTYSRLDVAKERFREAVAIFFSQDGRGLNVTLPHKLDAAQLATTLSARALRAGAVNTLTASDAGVAGDNTDGVGLARDLARLLGAQERVRAASVLMLGAGGAAQGALAGLHDSGCRQLALCARDRIKAEALASRLGVEMTILEWQQAYSGRPFDVVINATAASVKGAELALQPSWFKDARLAYDLGYGQPGAALPPFLAYARSLGVARGEDGLGMLVEQAAESFHIWHGQTPDVLPVLAKLKAM